MAKIAPIDDPKTKRGNLLYWAVVEQYRQSLNLDGIAPILIKKNRGLDERMVRRIALLYNVVRGIKGASDEEKRDKKDPHAKWIAKKCNALSNHWPDSLIDRAEECASIAEKGKGEHTNGYQASAVTKLMWFLKPDGWTMFDDLAATGIGIPKSVSEKKRGKGKKGRVANSTTRMKAFYRELNRRNFKAHALAINQTIKNNGKFERLYGERIIDKFLMLVGAKPAGRDNSWGGDYIELCSVFLELLPETTSRDLKFLADTVVKNHVGSLLEPPVETGEAA